MDTGNPNRQEVPHDPQAEQRLGSSPQPVEAYMQPQVGDPTTQQAYATQVNVTKKSKVPLIAGIVALVALFVVVAGGFWAYNRTFNRPAMQAGRVLPSNTIAYLTIDPSPEGSQKEAFDRMRAAFETQPGFKEAWTNLTSGAAELGESVGVTDEDTPADVTDFDALSSYLGNNVTIALLPPSTADLEKLREASSGGDSEGALDVAGRNIVGLVDLDFNPLNKKGPIADLKQQTDNAAKAEVSEKYRDIEIRKYVTGTTTLYFSLLNDTSTAVVGAKIEPLRVVIDKFKDDDGLKTDATFKALSGVVPQERIASIYINLTELSKQAQFIASDTPDANTPKAEGAWLMTLSGQPDGMQLDIASQASIEGVGSLMGVAGGGFQVNPGAKPDVSTLSDIPTGSLGFLVGSDLKSVVESVLDAIAKEDPESVASIEEEVQTNTGLDLRKDILAWMGGDYVLHFSLTSIQDEDELAGTGAFQLKLNEADRTKAADALTKLVESQSGGEQAEKIDVAGESFYAPTGPSGPIVGVGKDRLMLVFDQDADAAGKRANEVVNNAGKGFGITPEWKEVSKHLPVDSNLIGYVDITALREITERGMTDEAKKEYEESGAPFLRPLKNALFGSATQTTREGNQSRNHTVIFLGVSK